MIFKRNERINERKKKMPQLALSNCQNLCLDLRDWIIKSGEFSFKNITIVDDGCKVTFSMQDGTEYEVRVSPK